MLKRRKLLVWLTAFVLVAVAYLSYNRLVYTPPIQTQPGERAGAEFDVPELDTESARIGEAVVGTVEKSEYIVLDDNKNVKRVFGFARLLNPDAGTEDWKLQEPYMKIYEQAVRYEIVSDRGTCRVETVAGNPSPASAHLIDNVKIHILPEKADGPPASTICLDDLSYDSERSEFKTDGPITITSRDGRMEGNGMQLIYNDALGRVEYLNIKELHYLHLKNISTVSSSETGAEGSRISSVRASTGSGRAISPVKSAPLRKGADTSVVTGDGAPPLTRDTESAAPGRAEPGNRDDRYICRFDRDVVISYGGRIVAEGADEVTISNIVLSGWPEQERAAVSGGDSAGPNGAPDTETGAKSGATVASYEAVSSTDSAVGEIGPSAADSGTIDTVGEPTDDAEDVFVTCKGPMTIQPVNSILNITRATIQRTGRPIITPAGGRQVEHPARFVADKIDYDMDTDHAFATGPVKFVFYVSEPNYPDSSREPVPVVITADDNAEFFGDDNRVVFNGNVVGTRRTQRPAFIQTSTFRGRKLIVDLAQTGPDSTDIRHVAVVGGKVRLESVRSVDEVAVNHVRLSCSRIDYEASDEIVIASGPGDIQINNENAPMPSEQEADKKISLQRPCYALIRGFDELRWFTTANRITADGKTNSVNVSYLPIVEGNLGQIVRAATTHLEANFTETESGQSELATLYTTGGVTYREVGGNEFVGDTLFYDTQKSLITVAGSEEAPCLLNGALADRIKYDLKTGKAKAELASSPGTIGRRTRSKSK
ncbi:MAG TPA: LPS export ABC transporter periplasmic protein LptC [Planctomycetes bacterium]|nr:LPS export ABC transporter periplasmic protein LptC [Planctomycetota bacterium]HIJ70554.1 LPS export ABC transporter periplasmic protein LptC [Planctomycetota bacterium]